MRALILALLLAPLSAAAATEVYGQLAADATWTPAGNPYNLTGDLTVPAGVTLTIQPGVQVVASANADRMGGGANTTQAELIINGKLVALGSAADKISFSAASAASWYGIRILGGADSQLTYVDVSNADEGLTLAVPAIVTNSTFTCPSGNVGISVQSAGATISTVTATGASYGLYVSGTSATPLTVTNSTFRNNATGVYQTGSMAMELSHSLITGNTYRGVELRSPSTLHHVTVADNTGYGIYLLPGSGQTVTVRDSIISGNTSWQLYRATSAGIYSLTHNNVWGGTGLYGSYSTTYPLSAGTGAFSANPLFVGGSNYRITSNSPARKADGVGGDAGALPYTNNATIGLQGTLFVDTTLSGANSILGDLTVAPGVTLTLSPGATLTFPNAQDSMRSGWDTGRSELIVRGKLTAIGTSSSRILLTASAAYGWGALRFPSGADAGSVVSYVDFHNADYAVVLSSPVAVSHSRVTGAGSSAGFFVENSGATLDNVSATGSDYGLYVESSASAQTLTVTNSTFQGNSTGVYQTGAMPMQMSYSLVTGNTYRGVEVRSPSTFHHVTVADNTGYGFYLLPSSGQTVTVRDSIISGNTSWQLYRATSAGIYSLTHNNVWGGTGLYGSYSGSYPLSAGTGAFSGNPLFVGGSNYRITSNSPARKADAIGGDVGALPYTSNATIGLQGTLFVDTTLSGANDILGDLTVAPGVTLTLSPGTTLTFPNAQDSMRSGWDTGRSELIVYGKLTAIGTSSSRITLTASAAYGWGALRFPVGADAGSVVSYVDLHNADYAVVISSPVAVSHARVTGNGSSAGFYVAHSGATLDNVSATGSDYGLFVESSASAQTLTVTNATFQGNSTGVYQTGAMPMQMSHSLITGNTYRGVEVRSPSTFHHVTVADNTGYGFYFLPSSGQTVTVRDSIISGNTSWQLYRATSAGIYSLTRNNVWGGTGLYGSYSTTYPLSSGTDSFSANPLFVGGSNYRITSNSPARKADGVGGDIGALPYTSNATIGLQGTLFVNTTLSGANDLLGDLTVAPGVTLTLSPGATLTFPNAQDSMRSGWDTTRSELIVRGKLTAIGTSTSRITLTASAAYGWGALRFPSGADAGSVVSYVDLHNADYAVVLASPVAVSHARVTSTGGSSAGFYVEHSGATLDNVSATGSEYGLYVTSSANTQTLTVTNSTFQGNGYGVYQTGSMPMQMSYSLITGNIYRGAEIRSPSTLHHVTVADNSGYGIYLLPASGHTVTVRDSIISGNTSWQLYRATSAGIYTLTYNDVWGGTGLYGSYSGTYPLSAGTGSFSQNPLFVAAGDYRIETNSPCRNVSSTGGDIGAIPFAVGPVNSIVVMPGTTNVGAGQIVTFTAQAYDASNYPVPNQTYTWTTSGGGTVESTTGRFTGGCALGAFSGAVTASASGRSGSANVTIVPGPAATITVSPAAPSIKAGTTQAFTAALADSCGNATTAAVTWETAGGAGSINSSGTLAATCTPGSYANGVVAKSGGVEGKTSVSVIVGDLTSVAIQPQNPEVPSGGQQQFTATGADSCSNAIPSPTVTWSIESGGQGSIGSSTGLYTASSVMGSYPNSIRVRAGTAATSTTGVTITTAAVASVSISPTTISLDRGTTQTFTATARDSLGNVVVRPATFSVAQGGGTIDVNTGVFTAGATAGTFAQTVVVDVDGFMATASVTVRPGPAVRVVLSPLTATLAPGGMTTFSAQRFDSTDNMSESPVTWSVVDSRAGSISSSGVFTASGNVGVYPSAVKAGSGTGEAYASITIDAEALSMIVVKPGSATVGVGGTVAFSVEGRNAAGELVEVTPTWEVLHGGGTISSAGVFTAGIAPGTFADTVRAQVEGLSATASVVVTAGAVVQVAITPSHPTLEPGEPQQFTAVAKDAFGNDVQGEIVWSASERAGTISAAGLFTAGLTPGDYPGAVTAQIGGISSTASVNIVGEGVKGTTTGCGCSGSAAGALPFLAFGLLALLRRRRE